MPNKPKHTVYHDCPHCSYIGQRTLADVYDHLVDFYICDSGLMGITVVAVEHYAGNPTYVFQVEELLADARKLEGIRKAARRMLLNPKVKALITRKKNKKDKKKK